MTSAPSLLDPDFLRKLEALSLVSKRRFATQMQGRRRSNRRGASVDFADYREYLRGDDLRYVDWKAYGRLEKLFLKLFHEEEELTLHLLIDTSKSMDFGQPATKLDYARRVAAALGFVALTESDRVSVGVLSAGRVQIMPSALGRPSRATLFQFLQTQIAPRDRTDLGASLKRYAERAGATGIAIVLSDFFDETALSGVKALLGRGFHVVLVHILDEEEVHPTAAGDLRLLDSETGAACEVSISPHLLAQYEDRVKAFCDDLQGRARRYGVDYVRTTTGTPVEDVVLNGLRRAGLVR
jgi:uncharacterized protein (DUF58 family)